MDYLIPKDAVFSALSLGCTDNNLKYYLKLEAMENSLDHANYERRGLIINANNQSKRIYKDLKKNYINILGSATLQDILIVLNDPSSGEAVFDRVLGYLIIIRLLISGQIRFNIDVDNEWFDTIGKLSVPIPYHIGEVRRRQFEAGKKAYDPERQPFVHINPYKLEELSDEISEKILRNESLTFDIKTVNEIVDIIVKTITTLAVIEPITAGIGSFAVNADPERINALRKYEEAKKIRDGVVIKEGNINTGKQIMNVQSSIAKARVSAVVIDSVAGGGLVSLLLSSIILFFNFRNDVKTLTLTGKLAMKKVTIKLIDSVIISEPRITQKIFNSSFIPPLFTATLDSQGVYYSYINYLKRHVAREYSSGINFSAPPKNMKAFMAGQNNDPVENSETAGGRYTRKNNKVKKSKKRHTRHK